MQPFTLNFMRKEFLCYQFSIKTNLMTILVNKSFLQIIGKVINRSWAC